MTEILRLAVPTKGTRGMRDSVSEVFAKAPTFTLIDVVDGKVREVKVEENTALDLTQGVGPVVMKSLRDKGVNVAVVGEIGPGARTIMELSGIQMVQVEPGSKVSKAVRQALKGFMTVDSQTDSFF